MVLYTHTHTHGHLKEYNIDKEESHCIYIVKLIFIIFVVFLHSYSEKISFTSGNIVVNLPVWFESVRYIISKLIADCAVPGFFLISSILLYRKEFKYKDNIRKKVKTLLIPYIILNTFWIFFYAIAQRVSFLHSYFSNQEYLISNWKLNDFLNAYIGFKNGYPMLYPLWFLRDLFILNVFCSVIKKIIDKFPKITLVVLIIFYFLPIDFLSLKSIFFFSIGYYLVKYGVHIKSIKDINNSIIIIYLIGLIVAFFMKGIFYTYITKRILNIIGIIVFIKLAFCITNENILKLSKYSIFVYLFHENNLAILKKLAAKILPKTSLMLGIEYFLVPIIIICFCLFLGIFIKYKVPKLYSLLTGNWTITKK